MNKKYLIKLINGDTSILKEGLELSKEELSELNSKFKVYQYLQETNAHTLKNMADERTIEKYKELTTSEFVGCEDDGTLLFKTKSSDGSKYYEERIVLDDLDTYKKDTTLTDFKRVTLAITGDIRVKCSCPAFLWWGSEYILTYLKAVEGPGNTIFPEVRNPELKGSVCKHLLNVFDILPFSTGKIVQALRNKKIL